MLLLRRICVLAGLLNMLQTARSAEQEVSLWPENRFTEADRQGERIEERGKDIPDRSVANVRVPTLTVYAPASPTENRAAMIICPGGGYTIEAIDKEGHEPARWFQEHGVVGIVLKYRLPQGTDGDAAPLEDVSRAIRLVRQRASEWSIDATRIGVMGFSAGGHLASTGATHFDDGDSTAKDPIERVSSRPNFQILIYPVISMDDAIAHQGSRERLLGKSPSAKALADASNELQVTNQTPPAFLVYTSDDPVNCENALRYATALKQHGVPFELHLYERGGHGYGLRGKGPVAGWPVRLNDWLVLRGLIAGPN